MPEYRKDSEALAALTPEQHRVTQESGTERAFTGQYWNNHAAGLYVDIVSGEPLFRLAISSKADAVGQASPCLSSRPMSSNIATERMA